MDFVVRMDVWNKLSPKMKVWLDDEIQVYSNIHHGAIQKADMEAWGKFEKAGVADQPPAGRGPAEVPARRGADLVQVGEQGRRRGARSSSCSCDVMESHTCGYVTPDMYKGLKIGA